jgi:hypothetical protein
MRVLLTSAVIIGVCLSWLATAGVADTPAKQAKLRIGVYDSRAVCVGARDNAEWFSGIDQLMKQKREAEAAGDKKKVEEIKRRGEAMQQVRHLQGFSSAPVDDILDHVKDKLPEIAAKAGVDAIVASTDYTAEGVEIVDVTDQIVAALNPSEKTLKTVAELRKHKALPMIDVLLHHD